MSERLNWKRNARVLLLLWGLAACVHSAPRAPLALDKDTRRFTSAGTVFTAPAEWTLAEKGPLVTLTPPESNLRIALFESAGTDVKSAAQSAWTAFYSGPAPRLRLVAPAVSVPGWDEHCSLSYETSANDRRDAYADALRRGDHWTVAIVDGSSATLSKRMMAVNLVTHSLRPAGYVPENFAGRTPHALTPERIALLRQFLQEAMSEARVPGLAFSLIDHGKVVAEEGLGVRELGKPERVDPSTLFMAGSITKGMTTLMLARLVDQGKLSWDEPVVQADPQFRLGDAELTQHILVKQLLCGCMGMPVQNMEMVFEFAHVTPELIMQRLGTMKPTSRPGEVFQYSNIMGSAAGYVGAHVFEPGAPLLPAYLRAMQSEVFNPLGMTSTTFDRARVVASDHASPHGEDADGNMQVASTDYGRSVGPYSPSGAAWTSVHDLARFVQVELNRGVTPEGRRVVSEQNLLKRREPQISKGEGDAYGMGLHVDHRGGLLVVHHGGDILGFHANWYALPEVGVGAVLLTNGDTGALLREPFLRRLEEVLFDGQPQASSNFAALASAHYQELAAERPRLQIPANPVEVARLARRYVSSELGSLDVEQSEGQTIFDFGEWRARVASRRNDDGTLSFVTVDPSADGYEFVVGTHRGLRSLHLLAGQQEYFFDEASPP